MTDTVPAILTPGTIYCTHRHGRYWRFQQFIGTARDKALIRLGGSREDIQISRSALIALLRESYEVRL